MTSKKLKDLSIVCIVCNDHLRHVYYVHLCLKKLTKHNVKATCMTRRKAGTEPALSVLAAFCGVFAAKA